MSECTICFEPMNLKKDRLTQCYLCGNTVHTKCYKQWKQKVGPSVPEKCLYCQRDNYLYKINRIFLLLSKLLSHKSYYENRLFTVLSHYFVFEHIPLKKY